jgi:hypothetical protein
VATKVGTAYVDVVANFKPLNSQMRQLDRVSARLSTNLRRSMSGVSRDAARASRPVGRLADEVARVGVSARASNRQAAASMRQFEAACQRSLQAVRRLESAQRSLGRIRPSAPRLTGTTVGSRRAAAMGGPPAGPASGGFDPFGAAAEVAFDATLDGVGGALLKSFGTKFDIVRAFSPGISRVAASRLAVGMMSQAGELGAQALMKGLTKAIPAAGAAYGAGRILSSTLQGDMESAAWRAGGAAAGGAIGAGIGTAILPVGGTVVGGLVGAGIGESVGELGQSVFGGGEEKKIALQDKLAISARELIKAYRGQRTAGAVVVQSGAVMTRANRRVERSNRDVIQAEKQLSRARKRFGGDSAQATRAERNYTNAVSRQSRETQKAQRATRLHGVELRAAKNILKATTLEGRHRLILLQKEDRELHVRLRTAQQNNKGWKVEAGLMAKIRRNQIDVRGTQAALNRTFKEGGQQVGPKYAKFLRDASGDLLRVGRHARVTLRDIKEPGRAFRDFGQDSEKSTGRARTGLERLGREVGRFGKEARGQVGKASTAMRNFNSTTTTSLDDVKAQTNTAFVTIGLAGPFQKRQRGGAIVPGSGSGDTFPTSLPAGSFVLNRRATAAFGFRRGGDVPVMLEPGERVFPPDEVRQVGRGRLQSMNAAVPRFQQGGDVGGNVKMVLPHIVGPEPLRSLGQEAVGSLFDAVVKLIRREAGTRTYQAVVQEAQRIDALKLPYVWGGGHQSTPAPPNGPFDCSGAVSRLLQGAGFPIQTMVSSGFEGFGSPGRGKVSVLANPEHVYAVIGGRAWGTSEENPGGGAGWIDGYTYRSGFAERHADVLSLNVVRGARGRGQAAKKGYATGGFIGETVQRLNGGGGVKGPWSGTSVDRTFPPSDGASGETLPFYVAAALGEWAGLPGRTMAQIGKSENLLHPGTDVSDPPGRSFGWLAIHAQSNPGVTSVAMRNPILNVLQAKKIVGAGLPNAAIWHATKYVTGYDLHYDGGDPLAIARHLGSPDEAAGGGEKLPKSVSGAYDKHKAGDTGKGGGTYASGFERKYKAKTAPLAFGPLPKDEDRCRAELQGLEGRGGMLAEYRAAVRQAKGEARTALEANVRAVEGRIRQLRKQISTLRLKKAAGMLAKRMRKITDAGGGIEAAQRAYEAASQGAEQAVEMEPEEPGTISFDWIEKTLEPYIRGSEQPAFGAVLTAERDWRNRIIGAQGTVGRMEGRWENDIGELNGVIGGLDVQIDGDNARVKQLRKWIEDHPSAKERPQWAEERDKILRALPTKHDRLRAMRGRKKQLVEVLGEAKESWDPKTGTGSFEDSMVQVQGIQWPNLHEHLDALPVRRSEGVFGGAIRETQRQIEELQLKVDQAKGSAGQNQAESDTERAEIYEGIAREEQQRRATLEAQRPVLEGWDQLRQGVFAGLPKFHTGGQVPGPPQREVPIMARGGEVVFTPEQMQAMAGSGAADGSGLVIEQLVIHPDGRATVQSRGHVFDADVKRVVRGMQGTGRRVPGVFATRP